MRRALLFVAAGLAALPATAGAQTTPDGPATLIGRFDGPVPAIAYGPRAIVAWTVTVGPGSKAGPVRLRTTTRQDGRYVPAGTSPTVQLPAEPGAHRFTLNPGIALPGGGVPTLGLDQEVGGHAIVQATGQTEDVLEVLRGEAQEERKGERLALGVEYENDRDLDGLGDKTQDLGDLRVLDATKRDGTVTVTVRNAGTTRRGIVYVATRDRNDATCPGGTATPPAGFGGEPGCYGGPLEPGQTGTVRVEYAEEPPGEVVVASEGETDLTPDDNAAPVLLPLTIGVARVQAVQGALRVTARANREVALTVTARVAGMTLRRTLPAGRLGATLRPKGRKARQRLARALRGRAVVRVTIAAGEEERTRRVVLRR